MVRKQTNHGGAFSKERFIAFDVKPDHHLHTSLTHQMKANASFKPDVWVKPNKNPVGTHTDATIVSKKGKPTPTELADSKVDIAEKVKFHFGKSAVSLGADKMLFNREPSVRKFIENLMVFAVADYVDDFLPDIPMVIEMSEDNRRRLKTILTSILITSFFENKMPDQRIIAMNVIPEIVDLIVSGKRFESKLQELEERFVNRSSY